MSIIITTATTDQHLHQILQLQKVNLPKNISIQEYEQEGFVTVDHDFDTLKKMNAPYPHIIALNEEEVVGYALVMLQSIKDDIEILKPMFEQIDNIHYKSKPIADGKYFVMGQVCVAKAYRRQGVFYRMYEELKRTTQNHFDMVVTEVSSHNVRSLKAHQKQGFENILSFEAPDGHPWEILVWDFSQ